MSAALDGLTPTEWLVLDLLVARRRLGANVWSFPSELRPTLRRLESSGFIGFKHGVVAGTLLAWLIDGGPADAWTAPTSDHTSATEVVDAADAFVFAAHLGKIDATDAGEAVEAVAVAASRTGNRVAVTVAVV